MLRPAIARRFPDNSLRPLLVAVPAAALLLTGTALAQSPAPPQAQAQTQAQAPGTAPPLMTAPRPDDQPATDPVTSPPGVSGEAPSTEVQNPAAPAGSSAGGIPSASAPPVAALPDAALDPQQARSLVGTELLTRDGQPGGRILDFTLADPGGSISRVVVAPNEVLGLGQKLVAVPVGALMNGPKGPALDMSEQDLGSAPTFAYGQERTLTRPDGK
ncbi:PRC-barrel domain-containing protein [Azospirillum picis]|uniref:PRC-barrel domain-containing protein n=1 Tax=Azospirillum picis TaxID=488438 RepID=A0ABU0MHX7_9PROT|nr:PRC-barrel domain-containing protein [Azospirillum picis]MBP2298899.1 hypothetical protein [Azospirillum picis]MDQ0532859.1 hypothetical protein [Azospirillum picis]